MIETNGLYRPAEVNVTIEIIFNQIVGKQVITTVVSDRVAVGQVRLNCILLLRIGSDHTRASPAQTTATGGSSSL